MKLLTPQEVKDRKQAEIARDITKTENIKKALEKSTNQLNDINAKFKLALAGQHMRWAKEEEEYIKRIEILKDEIKALEEEKRTIIPIDVEKIRSIINE